MIKYIAPKSPEFNAVWDALKSVLEIPDTVQSLTITLCHDDVVRIHTTYYPKFIGEVPVTHAGEKIVPKPVGPTSTGVIA